MLDTIDSGGVLFVAARPAKPTSREASTLELNPMTAAEVEQAALAKSSLRLESRVLVEESRWTVMENPPLRRPQLKKEHRMRLREHVPCRSWCQWCIAPAVEDIA